MDVYPGEVVANMTYWPRTLSDAQAANVAGTLSEVLLAIVENPNVPIKSITGVGEMHLNQIAKWNSSPAPRVNRCAHELIRETVAATPHAMAVHSRQRDFTYRELDDASTRLAYCLVAKGVGPDVIVPLCFEKSPWAMVAFLGVLKAGGAFMFLDPNQPDSRTMEILGQVKPSFVITSQRYHDKFAATMEVLVASEEIIDGLPYYAEPPRTKVTPRNIIYVIFTSGSTGTPKGCVIEHSSFCTGAVVQADKSNAGPTSRMLQLAPFTFDVSILEMITGMISGACICMPDEVERASDIGKMMASMKITWAFLTPSLVKVIKPEEVSELKTLILGGEKLSKVDIETWADKLQLANGYGPTECSIAATCVSHITLDTEPSNIGTAIGGTTWIVDPVNHDQLSPIGAFGELLIEGPILARGYLNAPEKTAAVFIEDPIWAVTEGAVKPRRFYKTGDLVRYNSDGCIYFIGRKDTQIKVRGLRIEAGEIEHHLSSHPVVQLAVILAPKQGPANNRLVTVLIPLQRPSNTTFNTVDRLRAAHGEEKDMMVFEWQAHLSDRVPSYMVPEAWIVMDKIPLTTSGKADRKALNSWLENLSEDDYRKLAYFTTSRADAEKPATDIGRTLQKVVGRVLNLDAEQIGMGKSFMALGGDSISAMQVVSGCRMEGITVSVQDILRGITIQELAEAAAAPTDESLAVDEEETDEPFELTPIQQMYFDTAAVPLGDESGAHRFNQSFLLRLAKYTDPQLIARGIEEVVGRHSMLRAHFSREDDRWTQRIASMASESYRLRTHAADSKEEITNIMTSSQSSLNIQNGPLFAADIISGSYEKNQLLFLVAHHLIIDLVSWRIILHDLEQFLVSGSIPSNPILSFQTWSKLQAKYAQENLEPTSVLPFTVRAADVSYWGMSEHSNIQRDEVHQSFAVSKEITSAIDACHSALRTSTVDVLLGVLLYSFQLVFSDRSLPTIFSEGHGRQPWDKSIDLSETVGWFTTLSPVQPSVDDVKGPLALADMIRRVKDTRSKIPGLGWPYFASRYLNGAGKASFHDHWPMEILFNYIGQYQQLEREDSLIQQASPSSASLQQQVGDVGSLVRRQSLFDISAGVEHGQMRFNFIFSRHMTHQDRIIQWTETFQQFLKRAAEELAEIEYQVTLADFPLLPAATYQSLDALQRDRLPQIGIDIKNVEDMYPCSPMQRGLLISQSRSAGSYEVQSIFELRPRDEFAVLDTERLSAAWQSVVDRHSILRTILVESISGDGSPCDQVVLRSAKAPITVLYAGTRDPVAVFDAQDKMTFGGTNILHRFTICTTVSGKIFCKIEISHVIVDGFSIEILCRDLDLAYTGQLSAQSMKYSDFIAYATRYSGPGALDYWTGYLGQAEPCYFPVCDDVNTDRQLKSIQIELSDASSLMEFCKLHEVTPANVFQVVWGLVLRLYTGSDNVCFGYLTSGRDVPVDGIEDTVGLFINMLVCHMNAAVDSRLDRLMAKVKSDFVDAFAHQHCSLAEIEHSLGLGSEHLFNTVISFQREASQGRNPIAFSTRSISDHDPSEV